MQAARQFQSPTNRGSLSDQRPVCASDVDPNLFQSPTNRGSLSDGDEHPGPADGAIVFQSPTNRGSLSDLEDIKASVYKQVRFNPLPIGAVFPTRSTPNASRTDRVFQSPTNRGSLSDVIHLSFRRRLLTRFNPLPIGAVFPTEEHRCAPAIPRASKVSIPYQSGQSFRPSTTTNKPNQPHTLFQSPTNRGSLSDRCFEHRDKKLRLGRFNPLPIGAVFPT